MLTLTQIRDLLEKLETYRTNVELDEDEIDYMADLIEDDLEVEKDIEIG